MKMRLRSYIVRHDKGLAPNPFWDWCTLAVCTPNHQGSRLDVGDWIAGFLEKKRGYKFLYAMEISEILGLDEYFRDPRFSAKKPNLRGSWTKRCGDNFYSGGGSNWTIASCYLGSVRGDHRLRGFRPFALFPAGKKIY